MLAQFLAHHDIGIEPDVRFTGDSLEPGQRAVLFRGLGTLRSAPSSTYSAAALLLRLGAVVAAADDRVDGAEADFLAERAAAITELDASERLRLRAHLRWLLVAQVGTGGLKRRMSHLPVHEREQVGDFMVAVAAADGRIDPGEVKGLQRVFSLLDLDSADLFSRLHHATTDSPSVRPSTVEPDSGGAVQATAHAPEESRLSLDPLLIQSKMRESEAVFEVLKDVFADEAEVPPPPPKTVVPGLWGLDAPHSALVRELLSRGTWERDEFEGMAARYHLMPDGAIEAINEATFEQLGDFLLDSDDDISVHLDLVGEVEA
ncbi:MAG: TerB family tellurite resistance protein [Planctomycetes bacterium]|nr:TerB family tellurite resistance protein [Planctomycetota bacterium]